MSAYVAYDGTGQPVRDYVRVTIQCRNDASPPKPYFKAAKDWSWAWTPDDPDNDIIAYKIEAP